MGGGEASGVAGKARSKEERKANLPSISEVHIHRLEAAVRTGDLDRVTYDSGPQFTNELARVPLTRGLRALPVCRGTLEAMDGDDGQHDCHSDLPADGSSDE